ncbi:MAG TPA: BadF/BadG/BcrA/BcrD ATPase family protein [Anaerolineales bacterium]|nr:BadF/BadG/BcrA/BcrD ATPase family protein [Anaerolineales bacterium]
MQQKIAVGVDGGGTKTLALASSINGSWHGRGVAGPSNPHAVGFEMACAAIEAAISDALEGNKLAALCLGLAGVGRQAEVDYFMNWARAKFPGVALRVLSDAEILLAAAPTGPALALICGTGSIAYGRTAGGDLIRAGGWGYLFGDEGSGFAIGAAALRAVMQAFDGRDEPTLLTELIQAHRRLESSVELVQAIYGAESPRTEIADLAELVEQAAAEGDGAAFSILDGAAMELARLVRVVYKRLGSSAVSLALAGGVILHGVYLAGAFRRACNHMELVFTETIEVPEPAAVALILAHQIV